MSVKRGSVLSRIALLFVVYLFLLGLFTLSAPAFSRAASVLVPVLTGILDSDYDVTGVQVEGHGVSFDIVSNKLNRFELANGEPGPGFKYQCRPEAQAIHVYPVLALTLLAVWPATWKQKMAGLAILGILVLLAAAMDMGMMILWTGAECTGKGWDQIARHVPVTHESTAALKGMRDEFDRLTACKSFLSAGGRQFIALIIGGLGQLPWLLSSRTGRRGVEAVN